MWVGLVGMDEKSFVSVDESGGAAVARVLCPSIGQRESPIVESELSALGDRTGWRFAVDLSGVTVITSVGLGALISLQRSSASAKGCVALFGLGKELRALMKLTKLEKMLTMSKDEASAIKKVR